MDDAISVISTGSSIDYYQHALDSLNPETYLNEDCMQYLLRLNLPDDTVVLASIPEHVIYDALNGISVHDADEDDMTAAMKDKTRFIQPININNNHWILAYSDSTNIYIYDSLKSNKHVVDASIIETWERPSKKQVVDSAYINMIVQSAVVTRLKMYIVNKEPRILFPIIHTQTDAYNCGVFVIYYARCILNGVSIGPEVDADVIRAQFRNEMATAAAIRIPLFPVRYPPKLPPNPFRWYIT
jgi:hypothetical protein